jgi:hypothetical protein
MPCKMWPKVLHTESIEVSSVVEDNSLIWATTEEEGALLGRI